MGSKADRRAARERVASYHETQLGELIGHVEQAVAKFQSGELDAFEVDSVIHRYHRAARRLWVFCDQSGAQVEVTANAIGRMTTEGTEIDWWSRSNREDRQHP